MIGRLHEAYRRRAVSPVEIATAQLEDIRHRDREVNAFCLVDPDVTLAMAREAEARYRRGDPLGPLDGIPISVKDTINVAGWPTRRGSRTTSNAPVAADAVAARRLRANGAVFLGKTTTPEFAWKGLTDSPLTGVTRNPYDLPRTAGGSSGGAAAATALGLGVVALGSDAAGSVRIPAAFCGVVGYKPTFGDIPVDPYPPALSQLAHIGAIATTVADAALAVSMMSGADPADWTSLARDDAVSPSSILFDKGFGSLRIGVLRDDRSVPLDATVEQTWRAFLASLANEVSFVEVSPPLPEARDVAGMLYRIGCADAFARVPADRRSEVDPGLLAFVEPVAKLRASEILSLLRRREEIALDAAGMLGREADVIVTPTMPGLPPLADSKLDPAYASNWLNWNPFTPYFNLSHGPAISVPWWPTAGQGVLPIGIQVAAAPGRDMVVLRVAAAIERLSGPRRPPPGFADLLVPM